MHFFEVDDIFFWNSLPARLKAIESRSLVFEISSIPNRWISQLMPELELMLTFGWMCSLLLAWARAPSVGTSDGAGEREREKKKMISLGDFENCVINVFQIQQLISQNQAVFKTDTGDFVRRLSLGTPWCRRYFQDKVGLQRRGPVGERPNAGTSLDFQETSQQAS